MPLGQVKLHIFLQNMPVDGLQVTFTALKELFLINPSSWLLIANMAKVALVPVGYHGCRWGSRDRRGELSVSGETKNAYMEIWPAAVDGGCRFVRCLGSGMRRANRPDAGCGAHSTRVAEHHRRRHAGH